MLRQMTDASDLPPRLRDNHPNVVMEAEHTIGIDIGGTKIRGILWNGRRAIRAREIATPKNEQVFARQIAALVFALSRQKPPAAIAVGAAGIVEKATLVSSPNIPLIKCFDFRPLWPRAVPLRLDNDARCFARAELLRGAGRGARSLFALTIGTGVGRAFGRDGKIIKLKRFEYPEPWERDYQTLRDRRDDRELADFLGKKLFPLMRPFNPQVIVLGGGVMERHGFLRRLQRSLKARGLRVKMRRARFGKNAVAIGAALLLN